MIVSILKNLAGLKYECFSERLPIYLFFFFFFFCDFCIILRAVIPQDFQDGGREGNFAVLIKLDKITRNLTVILSILQAFLIYWFEKSVLTTSISLQAASLNISVVNLNFIIKSDWFSLVLCTFLSFKREIKGKNCFWRAVKLHV